MKNRFFKITVAISDLHLDSYVAICERDRWNFLLRVNVCALKLQLSFHKARRRNGTNAVHNNASSQRWPLAKCATLTPRAARGPAAGAGWVSLSWQSDTLSPVARFHCPARRDELRVVAVFISANDGCRGVVRPLRICNHNGSCIVTLIQLGKEFILRSLALR